MYVVLTICIWIFLCALMLFTAVKCVDIFKTHYINTNKVWKKRCCRVFMILSVLMPFLSFLKTIQVVCLAFA